MRKQIIIAVVVFGLLFNVVSFTTTAQETSTLLTVSDPLVEWEVTDDGLRWAEIGFDDLVPAGIRLQQSWNGMGMDADGQVYIGFTSERRGGVEDFVVFRYDPNTGEKSFLGTFVDVAEAADNLEVGESIPKGHTRMIYADGIMYMGSQGFHDLKWEIDDLPTYRGAHLFAFDTEADIWHDLAADLPGGVVLEHQGIVGLSINRPEHLLVGIAHPHSDIVLFDYSTNTLKDIIPGIPWELGNPLSREVIVAPSGRIYTYRGTEDPDQRAEHHPAWVYDPQDKSMTSTDFEMTNGFWIGQTATRDGSTIYVGTVNGQLYAFDTESETFTDLGHLLPKVDYEAGRRITYLYGVTLSPDETELYFVPSVLENPDGYSELYAYDIATGEVRFVQQMPLGIYTTQDLRDDNYIYLVHFGDRRNLWSDNVWLMIVDVNNLAAD